MFSQYTINRYSAIFFIFGCSLFVGVKIFGYVRFVDIPAIFLLAGLLGHFGLILKINKIPLLIFFSFLLWISFFHPFESFRQISLSFGYVTVPLIYFALGQSLNYFYGDQRVYFLVGLFFYHIFIFLLFTVDAPSVSCQNCSSFPFFQSFSRLIGFSESINVAAYGCLFTIWFGIYSKLIDKSNYIFLGLLFFILVNQVLTLSKINFIFFILIFIIASFNYLKIVFKYQIYWFVMLFGIFIFLSNFLIVSDDFVMRSIFSTFDLKLSYLGSIHVEYLSLLPDALPTGFGQKAFFSGFVHSHNTFLGLIVEFGILGLAFSIFIYVILLNIWRGERRLLLTGQPHRLIAVCSVVFVFILVCDWWNTDYYRQRWFWLSLGLMSAGSGRIRKLASDRSP